jgi:hypothetical protein
MKTHNRSKFLAATLLASLMGSGSALACDGMGPSAHMGQLMSVDAASHTFTIRDAQSSSAITFAANEEILNGLKGYAGSLMVNYQETDDGGLKAVGVTF